MLSHLKAFFWQNIKKKQKNNNNNNNKLKVGFLETRHLQMHLSEQTARRRLKAFINDHQKITNLAVLQFPL